MAKRAKKQPMTGRDWLALSDRKRIRKRMACDPYSMAYPALLSHFACLQEVTWDAAVLGLHIVYGWMPTIPRLGGIMKWDREKRRKLVTILTNAKNGQEPTDYEMRTLKAFCNNSVIGASKFLHFLRPETFPIWDSRVAKVYLKKPKAGGQQVNGIKPWTAYRNALSEWLGAPATKKKCTELRQLACFLDDVSDLRLVELVMFHKTKSKRKPEKN
jgi:uncharacterized protein DUF6308